MSLALSDSLNRQELLTQGWSIFRPPVAGAGLRETVQQLAHALGAAVPLRGRVLVQELRPTSRHSARPRSLSKQFGKGPFPLHVDTAHWPVPCRYIVMACAVAEEHVARTQLLPMAGLTLTQGEKSMLYLSVFRVRNGSRSFFATVRSHEHTHLLGLIRGAWSQHATMG